MTFKYLVAIATGAVVVTEQWVFACERAGYWVDETPYLWWAREYGCNGHRGEGFALYADPWRGLWRGLVQRDQSVLRPGREVSRLLFGTQIYAVGKVFQSLDERRGSRGGGNGGGGGYGVNWSQLLQLVVLHSGEPKGPDDLGTRCSGSGGGSGGGSVVIIIGHLVLPHERTIAYSSGLIVVPFAWLDACMQARCVVPAEEFSVGRGCWKQKRNAYGELVDVLTAPAS
jgi:hypothetical protein